MADDKPDWQAGAEAQTFMDQRDVEIAALKAERDRLLLKVATLKEECRGRADNEDRLRAALVGACEALEYNDEDSTYSILKTARRALEEGK